MSQDDDDLLDKYGLAGKEPVKPMVKDPPPPLPLAMSVEDPSLLLGMPIDNEKFPYISVPVQSTTATYSFDTLGSDRGRPLTKKELEDLRRI